MPSLRIVIPGKGPRVYHLYKKITTLGSSPDCDVVLPDPLVAETYAHLHHDGRDYNIATVERRDELSVNGKKRKKHRLAHRDRLMVGTIEVTFSTVEEGPAAAESAGAESAATGDLDAYRKLHEFSAKLFTNYDLPGLLHTLMDMV